MWRVFRFAAINPLTLALIVLGNVFVQSLEAQSSGTCSTKDYKVLGQSAVAIRCTSDATGLVLTEKSLYLLGDTKITPLSAAVTVSHFATTREWLLVTLAGPEGILKPRQNIACL
jgi:hypothetical protein